jgi:transketolase
VEKALQKDTSQRNDFDGDAAQERCKRYRRRILDVSQTVSALHVAPAFSCMEIVDAVYQGLMRRAADGSFLDTFLLSKGHGCMAQYVILEDLGILPRQTLDTYCTANGLLGAHPDYGTPGIAAATGSLGHGLSMAVGMAIAERNRTHGGQPGIIYTALSDGEVQEGSTWEAILIASSLKIGNLVAIIDNNDFQSLGRTSETHPSFYPLADKFLSFGWEVVDIDGHDAPALVRAVMGRSGDRPFMAVARTVKGKGVSYMENVPIWHYRAPNPAEYQKAIAEIEGWSS